MEIVFVMEVCNQTYHWSFLKSVHRTLPGALEAARTVAAHPLPTWETYTNSRGVVIHEAAPDGRYRVVEMSLLD